MEAAKDDPAALDPFWYAVEGRQEHMAWAFARGEQTNERPVEQYAIADTDETRANLRVEALSKAVGKMDRFSLPHLGQPFIKT
jgi:hypothetical protein